MNTNRTVAKLARRQHGLVAQWQLHESGISSRQITRHVTNGRLERVDPEVLRVAGVPELDLQRLLIPILAAGRESGAFVSGPSAAQLWGVPFDGLGPVHVTTNRHVRLRDRSIASHQTVDRWGLTRHSGIATSGPIRLLFEVAHNRNLLDSCFDHLVRQRSLSGRAVVSALSERGGRRQPGSAGIRSLVERRFLDGRPTDSELEAAFAQLLRRHDLPAFEFHRRVHFGARRATPDFVNIDAKVLIELDGFAFHGDRVGFERDRDRDTLAASHGWLTLRFTWHQVIFEPPVVAERLAAVLMHRLAA
jgi:very-short-patch-repair endonuclease